MYVIVCKQIKINRTVYKGRATIHIPHIYCWIERIYKAREESMILGVEGALERGILQKENEEMENTNQNESGRE